MAFSQENDGGVVPHERYFFFGTTLHLTTSFRGRAAPFVGFADISPHRGESPLTQGASAAAGAVQSESFLEPPAPPVVFVIQS